MDSIIFYSGVHPFLFNLKIMVIGVTCFSILGFAVGNSLIAVRNSSVLLLATIFPLFSVPEVTSTLAPVYQQKMASRPLHVQKFAMNYAGNGDVELTGLGGITKVILKPSEVSSDKPGESPLDTLLHWKNENKSIQVVEVKGDIWTLTSIDSTSPHLKMKVSSNDVKILDSKFEEVDFKEDFHRERKRQGTIIKG